MAELVPAIHPHPSLSRKRGREGWGRESWGREAGGVKTWMPATSAGHDENLYDEGMMSATCNRTHARVTKLSTTFFSPAFSKAMVNLLPSIRVMRP